MREIEFRFYDKKTGKILEECSLWWNYIEYINEEDVIVCQYTGLKDKHGNKIWEGDICKMLLQSQLGLIPHMGIMQWINEAGRWSIEGQVDDIWLFDDAVKGVEVIGNIYENPELIK